MIGQIDDEYDHYLKIVLVGDSGVGKTNILSRYTKNTFNENTKNTIGVDFSSIDLNIHEKSIKAQFWDTAGQEKYKSISEAYYRNSHGAFLIYDISNKQSFLNLESWLVELQQHGDSEIVIYLVGNKSDLSDQRQVKTEEGQKFAEKHKIFFYEVSAKNNNKNEIQTIFNQVLEKVVVIQEKEVNCQTDMQTKLVKDRKRLGQEDSCCNQLILRIEFLFFKIQNNQSQK